MKRSAALVVLCAMVNSAPAARAALGFDDARQLLNRTGFAANVSDIDVFARLTREQAVERLLGETGLSAITPAPQWANAPFESPRKLRSMSEEERQAFRRAQLEKGLELRAWWLTEMLATRSPLTEKMTLFWHSHFVSSQQKVRSPQLMYRQNLLLRRYALGNFGEFLHAVAKDPAMVVYLDSVSNRKGRPNENFAREVMELFTLGEGHYTERDVTEAARAFTGWSVDPASGEFMFRRLQHDDGVKTVLGHTGNFDGDAVLDMLLARPETAELIVAKLWREFVSPTPDPNEVQRIARVFYNSRYDIKAVLRALLTSNAFFAVENRGSLVKSPVELVVGTLRQFNFTAADALPFVFTLAQLGQNLFSPPNVKGWPNGDAWINSNTLLARKSFLDRLFQWGGMRPLVVAMGDARRTALPKGLGRLGPEGRERLLRAMADVNFDSGRWLAQFQSADEDQIERLVLAVAPVDPPESDAKGAELIRRLVQDPAYQLK